MTKPASELFTLDEHHQPVRALDLEEWADWVQANRIQARDEPTAGIRVVTIFLGFYDLEDPPNLFESAIIRGGAVQDVRGYPTHAAAMAGHRELVARYKPGR